MPPQAVRERTKRSQSEPFAMPTPEKLFQHLIAVINLSGATTSKSNYRLPDQGNEVIFEAELDGACYYIVRHQPPTPQAAVDLTQRELMIAQLIAKGLPNKSISTLLEISPYTVAAHVRRIFAKLGVSSRTAMVTRLLEENVLSLQQENSAIRSS